MKREGERETDVERQRKRDREIEIENENEREVGWVGATSVKFSECPAGRFSPS